MTTAVKEKQKLGPLQKKWLKALRSGKYKRTEGRLHVIKTTVKNNEKRHSFCCLGVACEILNVPMINTPKTFEPGDYIEIDYGYNSKSLSNGELPGNTWRKLGLYSPDGYPREGSNGTSLVDLNDTGNSFNRIADIIERDPSMYFSKVV